jgi:deoxyhypusine synthase
MYRTFKFVLTLLLVMSAAAIGNQSVHAQDADDRPDGYVNLRALGDLDRFFPRDALMEVNVEGILMRMVEEASRQEDPELADLLSQLDGVYVLGYGLAGYNIDDFDELATEMGDELIDDGWTVIVRYREVSENTHMFAKLAGDGVAGMVVMSVESGSNQAVFVNIVGDIDPGQIGKIGQKFQIGGMSDL